MAEKIGSGRRFRTLEASLAAKGAKNPRALAAHIGRLKYGDKRMTELSAAGKRRAAEAASKPKAPDTPPAIRRRVRL